MATPSRSSARTCLCSPTNHPGSFRCSLHRRLGKVSSKSAASSASAAAAAPRANIRQREEESKAASMMIKAFLMQIIKPSSHDVQRRKNFNPKPTRFCPFNSHGHGAGVAVP